MGKTAIEGESYPTLNIRFRAIGAILLALIVSVLITLVIFALAVISRININTIKTVIPLVRDNSFCVCGNHNWFALKIASSSCLLYCNFNLTPTVFTGINTILSKGCACEFVFLFLSTVLFSFVVSLVVLSYLIIYPRIDMFIHRAGKTVCDRWDEMAARAIFFKSIMHVRADLLFAGILTVALVCRKKKIPALAMFDNLTYGLLLGQIIGRWGNFMNREAFGAETDIFCRMQLTAPDGSFVCVHPTFLYESLWNLVGFVTLVIWERKGGRRYDGQAALGYFFWYGLGRTWIEGLRSDSLYIGSTDLRVSQLLSAVLCLGALALLIVNAGKKHPPEELYVNRVAAARSARIAEKNTEKTEGEQDE